MLPSYGHAKAQPWKSSSAAVNSCRPCFKNVLDYHFVLTCSQEGKKYRALLFHIFNKRYDLAGRLTSSSHCNLPHCKTAMQTTNIVFGDCISQSMNLGARQLVPLVGQIDGQNKCMDMWMVRCVGGQASRLLAGWMV